MEYKYVFGAIKGSADKLSRLNKIGEVANPLDSPITALQTFTTKLNMLHNLHVHGEPGGYYVTHGDIEVDLYRAGQLIQQSGRLIDSLKALGFADDTINTDVRNLDKKLRRQFSNEASLQGIRDVNVISKRLLVGNHLAGRLGLPQTLPELMQIYEANLHILGPEFGLKIAQFKTNVVNGLRNVGVWVPRIYRGDISDDHIYSGIEFHTTTINGCWIVQPWGERCLVEKLTCNGNTNPCVGGDGSDLNQCGPTKNKPCFTCFEWNVDGTCAQELPQCTGGDCSHLCANDTFEVPHDDMILQCVSANFWTSLQDFLNFTFELNDPEGPPAYGPPDEEPQPEPEDRPPVVKMRKWWWVILLLALGICFVILQKRRRP